jgi:hypothetical protein
MEAITESRGSALVGRAIDVMIDSVDLTVGSAEARTPGQAWETDGIVVVHGGSFERNGPRPGDVARVTITAASGFDLAARLPGLPARPRSGGETA